MLELLRVELEDVDAVGQPRRHVAAPERLEREARHVDAREGGGSASGRWIEAVSAVGCAAST